MSIPTHHRIVEPPPFESPPFGPTLLAGHVAIVTGGGSGMGLGMATALAQAGAAIAILGRTLERAQQGAAEIAASGARAIAIQADVRDPAQIAAAFDQAETALGPVSILANNAGGNYPVLAEKMSANQWRSITRIAIDGTFLCSTEFARRRIRAKCPGAIVNNSAQYVWSGFPGDAHSAAAKAAIVTMTTSLARDWKHANIRVNCVAAGFFPHARSGVTDPDRQARMAAMFPAGRAGRMREFGWAATFLCSDLAAGITGETLVIDGADRLRRELMSSVFVPPRERECIWGNVP